jgi:hypothetical protein
MYSRSFNHFHNPLKTWDNAGFKGTFQSSVIWAQDQGTFGSLWGGTFSWKAVREYFYIALTGKDFTNNLVAPTQTNKETYFGKTFRGIGQVMHLVQDVSVPAHTRNDTHVIGYHYELAVDKMRINGDLVFTNGIANPIAFDPAILTFSPNPLAPIPIAKIFDTDKYDPSNPDPAVTVSSAIGLSEYSNANFVSEGLLSANFQDFPFPRINDTSTVGKLYTGPSGTYIRQYYAKNCCGETNAGQGYLLSTVDLLDYWRQKHPLLSAGLPKIPGLDDNVYKDYASLLLPRAVGYSAGLLNYFFRGTIDITVPNSGFYALADSSGAGFTTIKVQAKNTTENDEAMPYGSIQLVVKYQPTQDAAFVYQVVSEATGTLTIPRGTPAELTFNLGTAIPFTATDVYLQLVYHGKLGNEDGAVAVGFKDISEPTPIDIYNDMDRISIKCQWYTAGSQEARTVVDTDATIGNNNGIADEWDIYPHNVKPLYIKISTASNPEWASPDLYDLMVPDISPATLKRPAYILAEHGPEGVPDFFYSFYDLPEKIDLADAWGHYGMVYRVEGTAYQNQVEYVEDSDQCDGAAACNIRQTESYYTYRGIQMWWGAGFIYENVPYPEDSQCSIGLL